MSSNLATRVFCSLNALTVKAFLIFIKSVIANNEHIVWWYFILVESHKAEIYYWLSMIIHRTIVGFFSWLYLYVFCKGIIFWIRLLTVVRYCHPILSILSSSVCIFTLLSFPLKSLSLFRIFSSTKVMYSCH